jgi:hypothetical protein
MLGEQSFDMRNVCIHSSGLLLFEPPIDDDDAPVEYMQLHMYSNIYFTNIGYGHPVTIVRNMPYPTHFQRSTSPNYMLLLAFGHPMSHVGHHMFESVLAAYVTMKAAALESKSILHVLLSSHYFSPLFPPSSAPTPKEKLLRSMWASAIHQQPLSIGQFLHTNSISPDAPVCYQRIIVGSIQDSRVHHPTPSFTTHSLHV